MKKITVLLLIILLTGCKTVDKLKSDGNKETGQQLSLPEDNIKEIVVEGTPEEETLSKEKVDEIEKSESIIEEDKKILTKAKNKNRIEKIVPSRGLYYYNGELANGRFSKYYPTDSLHTELGIKDGKLDGKMISFYEDGTRRFLGYYKDGKPNKEALFYYKDGVLKEEKSYRDGKADGEWKSYDKKGNLKRKTVYDNGEKLEEQNY